MRCVVETVQKRNLCHRAAALGGIRNRAGTFLQAPAQDVTADCLGVSFEKLMQPPRRQMHRGGHAAGDEVQTSEQARGWTREVQTR